MNHSKWAAVAFWAVPLISVSLFPSLAQAQAQADDEFVCTAETTDLRLSGIDKAAMKSLKNYGFTPKGVAASKDRWLVSDGLTPNTQTVTLGVYFLNGSSRQKKRVREWAKEWLNGELKDRIRFRFGVQRSRSHIRIRIGGRRTWSAVGRTALRISRRRETMAFSRLTDRKVRHEFGHALGLQHEHNHPDVPIEWNRKVVISYYKRVYGISTRKAKAKAEANVFRRLPFRCIGSPEFRADSIMLYPIPKSWTRNGFTVGLNKKISAQDRRCLEGLYAVDLQASR